MTTDAHLSPEQLKAITDQVKAEVAKQQPGQTVDRAKLEEALLKAVQVFEAAGIPGIAIGFLGRESALLGCRFSQPVPGEGQLDLAGSELSTIADRLRQSRLAERMNLTKS